MIAAPLTSPASFNLNDYVRVKLTDHGRALHRAEFDRLCAFWVDRGFPAPEDLVYRPVEEAEDGWSTWQLWDLMHTFGAHLYNGCQLPFHPVIELMPTH